MLSISYEKQVLCSGVIKPVEITITANENNYFDEDELRNAIEETKEYFVDGMPWIISKDEVCGEIMTYLDKPKISKGTDVFSTAYYVEFMVKN